MYEKLIKALKRAAQKPEIKPALLIEAAGAIERLEACSCPHYHRNVTDRGDCSYCDVFYRECGSVGWISVKDYLPEAGKDVFVLRSGGFYQIAFYGNYTWSDSFSLFSDVIFWMPLPTTPDDAAGAIERQQHPAWISTADGLPGYFVQVATTDGRSAKIRYLLNSGGVDLWGPDLMPLTVVTHWAPIPAMPEEAADEQA